ncbi:MAG: response regulator transcription factor [Gammaproteobacteria bacterium]|nr:response regulator transcription factor [Gammaproteobacteria bacterium]
MRLLLAEDDPMIGEAVRDGLHRQGFAVDWVQDGAAADLALETGTYDLCLLDLGLPRKEGLQILKGLRRKGSALPVVVMTARDSITDRVEGLDAGADDYVVKPFELSELAARVRAVLRRKGGRAAPVITHLDVTLDPATHEVRREGQVVPLSAREFAVLHALMEHPGRILSRAQLEERLYGWDEEVGSNVVEVHIHSLRRKLGADFIRNVRGVGYRVPPVE